MFVIPVYVVYGRFAWKQKNGSAFHDTWVHSPLRERCKSACLQHVLSYRDLWVHMGALLPFRVEEALETDAGELCKKEHQASFCPRDVGQQSPEERTLRCEWQACRAARVGAGLVHTSAAWGNVPLGIQCHTSLGLLIWKQFRSFYYKALSRVCKGFLALRLRSESKVMTPI